MDHSNQLDQNIYCVSDKKFGPITIQTTTIKKSIESLKSIAEKHYIKSDIYKYKKLDNCIVFDVECEYTGIHYHSIKIIINHNGVTKKTKHSAYGDGTLSIPNYESFLISKIKYFETTMPNIPIYIHESIISNNFHDKNTCLKW